MNGINKNKQVQRRVKGETSVVNCLCETKEKLECLSLLLAGTFGSSMIWLPALCTNMQKAT